MRPYKDRPIAATPPDQEVTWAEEGREFRAQIWDNPVLPDVVLAPQQATLRVIVTYDSRYGQPWLLATDLPWAPREVKARYQELRPVEQIPLTAKPMVGAHSRLVWAEESRYRLPEPALPAGSIQCFLAAILSVRPTGFWDRHPKHPPGRLRRALCSWAGFFPVHPLCRSECGEKASATGHLPKGAAARRRQAAQKTA